MNNDIKENVEPTLEYLKICVEDDILFETTNCKALLDYITNLQEKYERMKENAEILSNGYNDLEKRNEKAIEYNQQIIKDTKDFYRPTEDIIYSGDTLIDIAMNNINILQGGGE